MSKQITVNQHYVPQSLLKHFGKDVKNIKRLNIFDIARGNVRYNQSITENFAQNYFYDRNNLVEDLLSQKVETPASTVIDKIVSGNLTISNEDRSSLLIFISTLIYRTPQARQRLLSFISSFINSVGEQLLSLNGSDPSSADQGWIKPEDEDPSNLISYLTIQGMIDYGLLVDLDFHFVKNNTTLEFCISDHPAFTYNWFYKDLEHSSVTSLTARGLQIFLPLSPDLLICLYDSEVYKYGQKNSCVTTISSGDDVKILNSFQIINSESIIGFRDKDSEQILKELYKKNKDVQIYQPETSILMKKNIAEEEIKTTHLTFTRQTKLPKMPSFVKIKKKARKYTAYFNERDPELSALHQSYRKQLLE